MSKTKWGIRFQEYEILYYYSASKKKAGQEKFIFGPKKCFLRYFLFQLFEDDIL